MIAVFFFLCNWQNNIIILFDFPNKNVVESTSELESSPLRSYLPRIGKRSTSIDTSFTAQDSSPPSDPWKFFAEIKVN